MSDSKWKLLKEIQPKKNDYYSIVYTRDRAHHKHGSREIVGQAYWHTNKFVPPDDDPRMFGGYITHWDNLRSPPTHLDQTPKVA